MTSTRGSLGLPRVDATRTKVVVAFATAVALAAAAVAVAGCKTAAVDPPGATTSPQARAEPAPLAALPSTTNAAGLLGVEAPDAGPAPEPMRSDEPLAADVAIETVREVTMRDGAVREVRETGGYALQAVMRTGEGPGPTKAPEVNWSAIDAARRRTEARLTIEMNATRARFVLSGGFAVPAGTELRARVDRFGHLLLWPGEATYRIAEPGSLRALFGERRLDVAPLSAAEVHASGEAGRRLSAPTRRLEIETRAATALLDVATLRDSGEGGALVCRLLLELMAAPPSTGACAPDEVPMHAEIRWKTRGALTFDVTSVARRADFGTGALSAPPPLLTFVANAPPVPPWQLLLPRADLATFRTMPSDAPPPSTRDAQTALPESGLLLVNGTDELRVVWLDGVEVAWIAPGERLALPAMPRGRYAIQWRTFLGDAWDAPDTVVAPGVSQASSGR